MRFTVFLVLGLLVSASATSAQDIRWKPERMKPGDYVTIDQSPLIHHLYKGRSGNTFIIESFRGPKPEGKPIATTFLDKDGNYLKWVRRDGYEIRYTPHDCKRTLGKCQFTQTDSDGESKRRIRITKSIRGGYAFKEYEENGKLYLKGRVMLDDRGVAGNGYSKGDDWFQRYRLVRRYYQK